MVRKLSNLFASFNDGPQARRFLTPRPDSWLARLLVRLEESYYHQIVLPEILTVLKVNPAIAVQRKTTEDASLGRKAIYRNMATELGKYGCLRD